jgi:EpsD family peptidyl-prolyl cis-trans isomerase
MSSTLHIEPAVAEGMGPIRASVLGIAVMVIALAACGEKTGESSALQVAAKVNKEEISVHQINFLLQQQRGLKPEQIEVTSRQILERLVDQELALQKAQELKIDREPRVMQQLEASRREIIARAYADRAGEAAPKPGAEAIKKYYAEKPGLFKERRIYEIYELTIDAQPAQVDGLRSQLQGAKSFGDFIEHLKAGGYRYAAAQAVRAAEQLPLNLLDTFAKMESGQSILVPSADGVQVISLVSTRPEPVDEVRAKPAIEQYLLNDAKRKFVDADVKALRAAAKIEYVGKFAQASSLPASIEQAEPPVTLPATVASIAATDVIHKSPSGLK